MQEIKVTADSHIQEPPDLWSTRLPKHLRERALRINNHGPFEDIIFPGQFPTLTSGRLYDTRVSGPIDEFVEASVTQRLRHQESDGIWGEVMFPNHLAFMFVPDHELALAHCRVYNDYVVEAFSSIFDRHRPVAMVPLTDIDDAVAEIERVANLGLKGINIPTMPPGLPYSEAIYDPVWAAAEANGLVVTFHVGTGYQAAPDGTVIKTNFAGLLEGFTETTPTNPHATRFRGELHAAAAAQPVIMDLVGSGVLERFPELQVVCAEFNAYWLAGLMACMDKAFRVGIGQFEDWTVGYFDPKQPDDAQDMMVKVFSQNNTWHYPLRPSDYIRRQVQVTFMDDPVALACRHITGTKCLLWSNDYPHAEGTWPRSEEAVDQIFAEVDADDRQAIVGLNVAKLFDIKLPESVAV